MPIIYRHPKNFDKYQHTLPVCRLMIASSGHAARPKVLDGSDLVSGGDFTMWFPEGRQKVRATNMVWDPTWNGFVKESRVVPIANVSVDPAFEPEQPVTDSVFWLSKALQRMMDDDTPCVVWRSAEGNFVTSLSGGSPSQLVVQTFGNIDSYRTVSSGPRHCGSGLIGPGFCLSLWIGKTVSRDTPNDKCEWCGWDDVPKGAPHIQAKFGGISIYIVLPSADTPGLIRSAFLGRHGEWEFGRSEFRLSSQKSTDQAWPRLDVTVTNTNHCLLVRYDNVEAASSDLSRSRTATSFTHSLEPWTVMAKEKGGTWKGTIKGNDLSAYARRVELAAMTPVMTLHTYGVHFKAALNKLEYKRLASLQGCFAWDNRNTKIEDWPARTKLMGCLAAEQNSRTPGGAPYVPNYTMEYEWETSGGVPTGNVVWTMRFTDRPGAWDEPGNDNFWREDWTALVQGFTMDHESQWTLQELQYRDYGEVVSRVTGESSEPFGPGTTEYLVTIPLHHLEEHPTLKNTWRNEIGLFAPCELWLGWVANTQGDGAFNPSQGNLEADLGLRLRGYVHDVRTRADGEGVSRWLELTLRDELTRTQAPCAMVDGSYPPLDVLQAWYGTDMQGYQAVYWLLRKALGPAMDPDMDAVDENPYARWRFSYLFPAGQQKLVAHLPYVRGQAAHPSGSMAWPAPYGQDVFSWLKELCGYDCALLFARPQSTTYTDGAWDNVVWYVSWREWLYIWPHGTWYVYPLPMNALWGGNFKWFNHRIIRESNDLRPEEAINRVLVQAEAEGCPFPAKEWQATDWNSIINPDDDRWFGGVVNTALMRMPAMISLAQLGSAWPPGARSCILLAEMLFRRSPSRMKVAVPGNPYAWWGDRVVIPTDDPLRDPSVATTYRITRLRETAVFEEPHLGYETEYTLCEEPTSAP